MCVKAKNLRSLSDSLPSLLSCSISVIGTTFTVTDSDVGSKDRYLTGFVGLVRPRTHAQVAQRVVVERGAFRADQFSLQANFNAHYLHTGPEIWAQAGVRETVNLPNTRVFTCA
jgi:cysteine synthase